jgi:hypothetical protein
MSPSWKVLLIGGSAVARHFGISVLHADDLRLAIQQVTSPAAHPALHYFVTYPDVWREPPEAQRDALIVVGRAMTPALKIVIAYHVVVEEVGSIVLEGDGILPELAAQQEFTDLKYSPPVKVENQVRSLFLYEPDETAVLQNMRRRGRGFEDFSPEEQRQQARAAWLYGLWLHDAAQKNSLSVGAWETLTKRVLTFANDSSTLNGESCPTTDIEQ